jgi:hypothetical protein
MDTHAPTAAAKKDFSPGCLVAIGAAVVFVVVGLLWNVVTGSDGSRTRDVSRASYAGMWPLTVDSATIGCDGSNPWVRIGGDFYALNGTGRGAGYKDIDPIWAYDASGDGLKVSIAPLRDQAQKLC